MEDVYNHCMERCTPYPNFTMIRKRSVDVTLEEIPKRSLDFVYIDANHLYGYAAMDLQFWSRKVKRGGIIAGHDYWHLWGSRSCRGVKSAVDGFVDASDIENFWVLGVKGTLKKPARGGGGTYADAMLKQKKEAFGDEKLDSQLSFMMFKHW